MKLKSAFYEEKKGELSASLVDEFSDYIADILTQENMSRKEIIRFRLSLENMMCVWLDKFWNQPCTVSARRRFGRMSITVSVEGPECDPRDNDEDDFGELGNSSLIQSLGLAVSFSYKKGVNNITVMPPSIVSNRITRIFAALAFGVILGLLLETQVPTLSSALYKSFVSPIFDALMGLLKAIASPLIFLAVLSGIYDIGDMKALGNIGRKLITRFIFLTFLFLGVNLVVMLPIIHVSMGGQGVQTKYVSSMMDLVLTSIPSNIFSPFIDGNMLQVIFLSVCCGMGMLVLGDKVSELNKVIGQIYSVVQLLMEVIGKMIPLFIFLSSFSFILSGSTAGIKEFVMPLLIVVVVFLILALFYAFRICQKFGIKFVQLVKKLMPTYLVALTTASSAAAFSINISTCEDKLGVSSSVTRFGIPLGQVVYMPLSAVETFTISMIFASNYDVKITPIWIITALLVCGILAIATPPIPGGAMSIFTILFLQLGIPSSALALAISIDLLLDYIITAGDITCLQEELILSADKLGMLNHKKLLK